jgi:DNA uptake protein ComE-like DNA-binding protein
LPGINLQIIGHPSNIAQIATYENLTIEPLPEIVLRDVDVNTATEADIANVISVGPKKAAEIIAERDHGSTHLRKISALPEKYVSKESARCLAHGSWQFYCSC